MQLIAADFAERRGRRHLPTAGLLQSAERAVFIGARIVGKWNAGVELHALECRKEEHCLDEIHLELGGPLSRQPLDRHLIGPTLAIEFDPASKYTIRARALHPGARRNLAVASEGFLHSQSPAGVNDRRVAEAGGMSNPSGGGLAA